MEFSPFAAAPDCDGAHIPLATREPLVREITIEAHGPSAPLPSQRALTPLTWSGFLGFACLLLRSRDQRSTDHPIPALLRVSASVVKIPHVPIPRSFPDQCHQCSSVVRFCLSDLARLRRCRRSRRALKPRGANSPRLKERPFRPRKEGPQPLVMLSEVRGSLATPRTQSKHPDTLSCAMQLQGVLPALIPHFFHCDRSMKAYK